MFEPEKSALELIDRGKEELKLEEEIIASGSEIPQTAAEWMAWLIDHVLEDVLFCVQQESSLKWTFAAIRLIERLEVLGIVPSSDKQFWMHSPEIFGVPDTK